MHKRNIFCFLFVMGHLFVCGKCLKQGSLLFFYTFLKNVQIIKGEERLSPQEKSIEAEVTVTTEGSPACLQAPEDLTSLPGSEKDGGYGTRSQGYPNGLAAADVAGRVLAGGGGWLYRSSL